MSLTPQYDELEFERLQKRLLQQRGNAFFCVTIDAAFSQIEIAERMCTYFPADAVQIIDFNKQESQFRFSSNFLRSLVKDSAKFVFLVNFHLACGDMEDAEFFQVLNLSRDALAQLPVAFVFMMPLYFRKQIARKAPDFNSFFAYRADFTAETVNRTMIAPDTPERYSETSNELLQYYKGRYSKLTNQESKEAFETILKILRLNVSVRTLSYIELNRFYGAFTELLPLYQDEIDDSLGDIARVYDSQGDYAKALEWYMKELATCKKVLGEEHHDTAAAYNNIAYVYNSQGDYTKALWWYMKSMAISEKVLGKEHPDTATTYNNIGGVYDSQGDYAKALKWNLKALHVREKVLGKEHPGIAITYNNIGGVYDSQGNYAKALKWFLKALAIFEKVLSKEHPDIAIIYNNIAGVYDSRGDYVRALEWYEKSYSIFCSKLGKTHPSTVTVKDNMEVTYQKADFCEPFDQWLAKNFDV